MAAMISSCVRPNSVRAVLSLSVAPLRPHSSESRSMTGDYLAWRHGAEGTLVEPLNIQQPRSGIDDVAIRACRFPLVVQPGETTVDDGSAPVMVEVGHLGDSDSFVHVH